MIKAIGLLMIIGSCSAIGFSAKRALSKRSLSLKSLISALEIVRSEIIFREKEICEIIPLIKEYCRGVSVIFFDSILRTMNEKKAPFSVAAQNASGILSENGMKPEDVAEVLGALSVIGRFDSKTQGEQLEKSLKRLCELESSASEESEKNGKLYGALGVTAGILLAVVII